MHGLPPAFVLTGTYELRNLLGKGKLQLLHIVPIVQAIPREHRMETIWPTSAPAHLICPRKSGVQVLLPVSVVTPTLPAQVPSLPSCSVVIFTESLNLWAIFHGP
jgi:hypothetical protein